ncbi:hypothetical protein [Streptomyces sp. NPDC047046]|uniref:hypothetical protein n=1 Tax=Streptomyces sp. NPDC047046 TaxID=3155378 RepID=UPI0033ED5C16
MQVGHEELGGSRGGGLELFALRGEAAAGKDLRPLGCNALLKADNCNAVPDVVSSSATSISRAVGGVDGTVVGAADHRACGDFAGLHADEPLSRELRTGCRQLSHGSAPPSGLHTVDCGAWQTAALTRGSLAATTMACPPRSDWSPRTPMGSGSTSGSVLAQVMACR